MKRRYANAVEGDYFQERVDDYNFHGYICYIRINNVKKPLIVNTGEKELCIKDENYEWYEVYPDNGNYALTIMYDDNNNLIEWYFDIAKKIGIENGIPYEDDLYLDMIITPDGEKIVIDEDELLEAEIKGVISKEDIELAYKTIKYLDNKYVSNLDELIEFTNNIKERFNKKNKLVN